MRAYSEVRAERHSVDFGDGGDARDGDLQEASRRARTGVVSGRRRSEAAGAAHSGGNEGARVQLILRCRWWRRRRELLLHDARAAELERERLPRARTRRTSLAPWRHRRVVHEVERGLRLQSRLARRRRRRWRVLVGRVRVGWSEQAAHEARRVVAEEGGEICEDGALEQVDLVLVFEHK